MTAGGKTAAPVDFRSITPAQALSLAEHRRTELVELLSKLVSVRSQSGESAEAAQDIVIEYLSRLTYRVERSADKPSHFDQHVEYMPPVPPGDGPFVNIVARPQGNRKANLALFAHIDTHGVEDGWVTNPYEAILKDGRLYGLGSADGKGGIAAMLVTAAALADAEGPAPIVISIHGKGGGSRGSLPVFERLKNAGKEIHAVLYAHPAETGRGLADIKHVVRGVLDIRLAVDGWQGEPLEIGLPDSARWSEGGDALDACWQAIAHLKEGVLRGSEVNVGRLEAGRRAGAVPDQARADIRILFDGGASWKSVLDSVRSALESYSARLPARSRSFRMSVQADEMRTNPGAVPWNAPACLAVRSAIEGVTGSAPVSYPNHYGGDIRFPLRLLGVPAVGIGSLAGNFYGPNEWVDVDDLVRLVAVLILAVSGWNNADA